MKIGLIVDGQAEFRSLPQLYKRLNTPHQLLTPLYADIQPFAPLLQIARTVQAKAPIFAGKGAELIIILVDRETRRICPGQWARDLAVALNNSRGNGIGYRFAVVVKNSCYENWLISDPAAFKQLPRRFKTPTLAANNADQVDAQAILKAAAQGSSYSKINDAVAIMGHADPLAMAANSRSFRRLLREIENPKYLDQSRQPAALI